MLLEEAELREIRRIARARRMTGAEWVRHALRAACREEPVDARGGSRAALTTDRLRAIAISRWPPA